MNKMQFGSDGGFDRAGLAIGVDVGGTFTDIVCSDGQTNWRAKSPTNPANFGAGVVDGLGLIAEQREEDLSTLMAKIVRFGLGTTAVTNVLATRKGRRVGLITTKGFEGHLRNARGRRIHQNGWLELPWSPVEESCIVGISERVDRNGVVQQPFNDDEFLSAVSGLLEREAVDAFAISFLWSCRNAEHEKRGQALLEANYPHIPVFSGVELLPVMREYERTTTAVLNAFCVDALEGVDDLELKLAELGLKVPMLLMHASGGMITVAEGKRMPLGLASSGPAAGAVASAELVSSLGIRNAVCADMGGTSIDVAVIQDGEPVRRQRGEVNGIFTAQSSIDVESIGAGGGSIAWIDSRDVLRVGPHTARATPGPVCYGRGGTEATVTDAMVVLGYIDPDKFIGGTLVLDREAARKACEKLGAKIGLDADETAWGIREIAIAEMAKTVRARLATSGMDPRELALVAYGGAGSLFTTAIAEDVGVPEVVSPQMASVLSAFGAAVADLRRERVAAVDKLLPDNSPDIIDQLKALSVEAARDLTEDGVAAEDQTVRTFGTLRFYRQKWEITLPLASKEFDSAATIEAFRGVYASRYSEGALATGTPVEMVSVQAVGEGRTIHAPMPKVGSERSGPTLEPSGARDVYFGGGQTESVPTYVAEDLVAGDTVAGPALIDAKDTTVWVPHKAKMSCDSHGTIVTKVMP